MLQRALPFFPPSRCTVRFFAGKRDQEPKRGNLIFVKGEGGGNVDPFIGGTE